MIANVRAMTDVTGFGLLGHGLELARGSGVSLEISYRANPVPRAGGSAGADGITRPGHPGATGPAMATPSSCRRSCRRGSGPCSPIRKRPAGCWSPAPRSAPNRIRAAIEAAGYPRASIIGSVGSGGTRDPHYLTSHRPLRREVAEESGSRTHPGQARCPTRI